MFGLSYATGVCTERQSSPVGLIWTGLRSLVRACGIAFWVLGWIHPVWAMHHPDRMGEELSLQKAKRPTSAFARLRDIPPIARETLLTWARLPSVNGFNTIPKEAHSILPWVRYEEFYRGFVVVPSGSLPLGSEAVDSFEAARAPVTRALWNEIMPDRAISVDHCANCPVTDVAWEHADGSPAEVQEFLERLNERTQLYRCIYDLPTDQQLWYMIRADVTGRSLAPFGLAGDSTVGALVDIRYENADDYIFHEGNSRERIQPIGSKRANAFGIELGNVWKMSKDPFTTPQGSYGRVARGGSWFFDLSCAESSYRTIVYPGDRQDFVGLSLVRTCQ